MLKNNYLTRARREKNDEFYTQYCDVERECNKFRENLRGKVIYCPCDDQSSNFPKYFKDEYHNLELKGLYFSDINCCTNYYDGVEEKMIGGPVDIRTQDFVDILKKCDVVVTNPPFSLFIEFLNTIIENGKDFLIIGQQNTISCKDVFSHLIEGRCSVDYGFPGIAGWFMVPDDYEDVAVAGEHKEGMIRVSGVIWYTSFEVFNDNKFLKLTKTYYNEDGTTKDDVYPKYDNFRAISGLDEDAIECKYVKNIPCDYYGYIGVPISFFGKYNPEQFELIQLDHYGPLGNQDNMVNGVQKYRRIYAKLRKK